MLRERGASITDIAEIVGLSRTHTYKWLWAFQFFGIEGLRDRLGRGGHKVSARSDQVRRHRALRISPGTLRG